MTKAPDTVKTPLNKYKVFWDERISENDGFGEEFGSYYTPRAAIVHALNEDEACDIWDERFSNEGCNGVDRVELVVEHPMLDKHISISMIDDNTYLIPIDYIAKFHAEKEGSNNSDFNSIAEYLLNVTIPYFENNEDEIIRWASQNIGWNDIKKVSYILPKEPKIEEMQTAWQRAMGATIIPLNFNNKNLKTMSATTISVLICDAIDGLQSDAGLWGVKAKELVECFIPILVKMRDIGWHPITVDSICKDMSFFDVCNFGFSKDHSYPIDEIEYQLLIEPLTLYAKSLPEFNPELITNSGLTKAEEHHGLILNTVFEAISTLAN